MEFRWKRTVWAIRCCHQGEPRWGPVGTQRPQGGEGKAAGIAHGLPAPPNADRPTGLRGTRKPTGASTTLPRPEALAVGTDVRLCPKSKKNKKIKNHSSIRCWILLFSSETSKRLTSDILESQSAPPPLPSPAPCPAQPGQEPLP